MECKISDRFLRKKLPLKLDFHFDILCWLDHLKMNSLQLNTLCVSNQISHFFRLRGFRTRALQSTVKTKQAFVCFLEKGMLGL